MARLPYPFKGAPRFVVDSEGVVTDQRVQFIEGTLELLQKSFTNWMIWSQRTTGTPSWDFWPTDDRPDSEAADAFEYATKPFTYTEFVTVDEAPGFDEKALDDLIADQLKAQREARERLVFEEQSYNGNPDCLLGISGCTCKQVGLPKGRS